MKRLTKWQEFFIVVGVVVLLVAGCNGSWMMNHPAPLGRSAKSVTERVGGLFPLGVSIDSVKRHMASLQIPVFAESDSAGLHQVIFREKKAALPMPWSSDFWIYFQFDASGHLKKSVVEEHQL